MYLPISSVIARLSELHLRTHPKGKQSIWLKILLRSLSIGLLLPTFALRPVLSAERLNLSYGLVQRSIPINSLETYARTGKIDDELATYAQYAGEQQLTQLRQLLVTPIPLNAVQISQFLYTPIGKRLLENLGEIVQQETRMSGFYAIRAALILASVNSKEGFTLLNVLRKFPSNAITIDLARSLELVNQFRNFVNQTQAAVNLINSESNQEAITPQTLTSTLIPNLQQRGRFGWQKQTITLFDISRQRKFTADIYLPNTQSPRPVIVISHGLGSDRTSFAYLANHLASYGFVVAVPEHPGSNTQQLQALLSGRADEVTNPREFIDRPLDVKYLLDELTRLSSSNPAYKGRFNFQQVGVVGQSFGGYTALALAGATINFPQLKKTCQSTQDTLNISLLLQCLAAELPTSAGNLSDSRVKAVIAINPVTSSVLGQANLSQIKIPIMIISGSADTIAPALPEQIQPFTWLTTSNKYLALINGGTHFSVIGESQEPGAVPVPEQVIGPNPAVARRYVNILSLAFFQSYVALDQRYLSYLSPSYSQAISQEPLPLSLVRRCAAACR
ncbi:alpha/beta hydrolase [Iningainema tapete]|uniref:Alpha/beta hydrolase n=1 Tax=Iningainema tapete BLCC-T55 TaxID=2748662 RepID=A0A8J6XDM6_9CYAN|nr:alpha/beta hydrolase [Iningainema tapete]MBD2771563.1 alpha/beta hydrolase [Iningainema tapete BLCC-T55]